MRCIPILYVCMCYNNILLLWAISVCIIYTSIPVSAHNMNTRVPLYRRERDIDGLLLYFVKKKKKN